MVRDHSRQKDEVFSSLISSHRKEDGLFRNDHIDCHFEYTENGLQWTVVAPDGHEVVSWLSKEQLQAPNCVEAVWIFDDKSIKEYI